jgi:cold shock CspA family protein
MRYQGKIEVWKDDRGFGSITPGSGGAPVFVHITGFKNGQRRPSGNELVTYEVFNDPKRGLRAQNVAFYGAIQPSVRKEGRRLSKFFMIALFMVGIGIYAWQHLSPNSVKLFPAVESILGVEDIEEFECQGKRHCSEMTSCEEAIFYLKNCPDVEIDGDGDGIPCESEWCGH